MTETWEVRGYQMIACGKQRNERIELAGGRRESVQQHDRRRILGASFAVEDADAINCHTVIGRGSRNRFHRSSRGMANDYRGRSREKSSNFLRRLSLGQVNLCWMIVALRSFIRS